MLHEVASILRCPITYQEVRPMTGEEVRRLRTVIDAGHFAADSHATLTLPIDSERVTAGLTTVDGRIAYPVDDDVIQMLPESAIPLQGSIEHGFRSVSSESLEVRRYFDAFGWTKTGDGKYRDLTWEDQRPVCRDYNSKSRRRVMRFLKRRGSFFLDVGSGPVPHPGELLYSREFDIRVCVDTLATALRDAKARLGERCLCLLADAANLPLREGSVDAATCIHALYHVPVDEQPEVICELHRVLRPSSSAVVVTAWNRSASAMRFVRCARAVRRFFARLFKRSWKQRHSHIESTPSADEFQPPPLYYRPQDYSLLAKRLWGFDLEIRVWRSVSEEFTRTLIHGWLLGKPFLNLIYRLEEWFPLWLGRFGSYPLIVIKKKDG